MCGICGIVNRNGAPVDEELLKRMNTALYHRGPDGEGYYRKSGVGLAMRRLAIIDLVTGDQPIANENEDVWVVFNGELYNFLELRRDLEARGHVFRTNSDTECIVHLYEEYGSECMKYLRGMFALALWDEKQERLLLVRDRLGKKPLYYAERGASLYFSSELPSLMQTLRAQGEEPGMSISVLDAYLSLQYVPEPYTPYEGIYKLPAAHRMIWGSRGKRIEEYWQLGYLPKWDAPEEELIEETRRLVGESVRMRMISDVPLGAHLSGGIDSSIVVALMAEASDKRVKTFSVGFEEARFSELGYARQVANRYATEHHEFTLTFKDLPATLRHLAIHLGEPLADPSAIPLYHLSMLTRRYVTVALNGDGGDEIFAGYQRYWLDPLANAYLRLPHWFTCGVVPSLARILPDDSSRPTGASLVNGLKRLETLPAVDARASILRWGSYFSPAQKAQLWRKDVPRVTQFLNPQALLAHQFDAAQADSYLDRTLYTDITTYLPGDLLVKADRMTMASSLEGRSPFLDHVLVEWAARLPENMKVRRMQGKYLLRKAFADKLPEAIQKRGKQGFGIPVGAWLRGPLAGWARETLLDTDTRMRDWFNRQTLRHMLDEHALGKVDHGKRIWALLMLALWMENV